MKKRIKEGEIRGVQQLKKRLAKAEQRIAAGKNVEKELKVKDTILKALQSKVNRGKV